MSTMKLAIAILILTEALQGLITIAQDNDMPNDFLVSKWQLWFKSMDINQDGTIPSAYVEESMKRFSELQNLTADEKTHVEDIYVSWWVDYIFHGYYAKISEQEFISTLRNEFKANKQQFVQTMQHCFDTIFDLLDSDQDEALSEEEYIIALKAYGHENVDLDTKFHEAVDELVPLKDIVALWVDFTTSEDIKIKF